MDWTRGVLGLGALPLPVGDDEGWVGVPPHQVGVLQRQGEGSWVWEEGMPPLPFVSAIAPTHTTASSRVAVSSAQVSMANTALTPTGPGSHGSKSSSSDFSSSTITSTRSDTADENKSAALLGSSAESGGLILQERGTASIGGTANL